MNISGAWTRALELGPGMIAARLSQRAARRWAGVRASLLGPGSASSAMPPHASPGRFFLSKQDVAEIRRQMETKWPAERAAMVQDAELSLKGSIPLLTGLRHDFGAKVNWRLDPTAPCEPWPLQHFTRIDALRLGEPCDIKIPWEVGRGTHLVRMAQAYVLTGEERFAAAAMSGMHDFLEANPPEFGPQWVTPMEVALRLIHWIWVDALCEGSASFTEEARSRIFGGIHDAAKFIARFPEREPISGNHYWFNGLGLWYAGVLGGSRCRGFARTGRRIVEEELFRQVFSDGMSFEASTGYHRLVTELMLHAVALAELQGEPLSPPSLERVERMLRFTAGTLHPGGRSPQLGDHDDGRVVAFAEEDPLDHRHLLAVGGACMHLPDVLAMAAGRELESLWFPGPSSAGASPAVTPAPQAGASFGAIAFPEGGVYVLRAGPLHSVWDAGPLGKAGNGVHGHADLLSGEFSVGGRMVVVECGTYGYTSDPARRNQYRGVGAHNGILVNDLAWTEPGTGLDLWRFLNEVPFTVQRFGEDQEGWALEASHEGYRTRGLPVTLSRRVWLRRDGMRLEVTDRVTGEGAHRAALRWHLAPADWEPAGSEGDFSARVGPWNVQVGVRGEGMKVRMESSERSERWGEKHPGPMLVAEQAGKLPLVFQTSWDVSLPGGAQGATWQT